MKSMDFKLVCKRILAASIATVLISCVEKSSAPVRPENWTILPGATTEVELLTGVHAPVEGTPSPVVFKITGDVIGPDGSTFNVGEGRLLAAAQGSEFDGRALFRLTQLAIRQSDGRRSVTDVDGWVLGEDGIRGVHGRLIDKLVTQSFVDLVEPAVVQASNRERIDSYEKLTPIVELLPGRKVLAVFSRTAEIEIIDESADEEVYSASLD